MEKIKFYKFNFKYYFELEGTEIGGKINIGRGNHGGEYFSYLDYIDWECDEPSNSEEIEKYIDDNLYKVLERLKKFNNK